MDLNDLYPAVLTIVLIGLVLGIGIYVMAEVREEIATDHTGTDFEVNVTATSPANTTTLSDSTADGYYLKTIDTVVYDNGSATVIPASNYSFTTAGVITWADELVLVGDNRVNVTTTYIYDATNSPEEAVNDSLEGLADFASWIAVIVVVLAAAIVLGIVLRSFGQGRSA